MPSAPLEAALEAVFRALEYGEGAGLLPSEENVIARLTPPDKAALEAKVLEAVEASGAPDCRQLRALELIGSPRAAALLRRAFASAGRRRGDWMDLEFAVALWRTDKDEAMLDYALAELSGLFVTRRRAAARALGGARCAKAEEALRGVVFGDGEGRLRFEALSALSRQLGLELGVPPEDSVRHYEPEAVDALIARLGLRSDGIGP
ncbi:MAG: hypothetical protein HY928_11410 [Elusimicrobia bacterium]|nr:hypothetical protein [Elusimicrobiota bacterium]